MQQTVLVVEDDPRINEVVTEYMKEAGYLVLSLTDGEEALSVISEEALSVISKDHRIDLFVLDIMLPGISGLKLLQAVRQSEQHKDTPVIMLTALGDEQTQLLSFDALADDYVTKPFSPKILVKRAQALLRRHGREKTLVHGDIVLSYESYEVAQGGQPIKLTRREFEMLGAFMASAGKVLTRQQLLDQAWGYDYFGDDRIVDVHIKNLRRKLSGEVIHTIKGVGYKFGGK
ncbi:MAG: response regulator transcription factor [Oscillospiraceae bacterium]|nr:response regulator transcription factor [Oscillospiraceae bacterium]